MQPYPKRRHVLVKDDKVGWIGNRKNKTRRIGNERASQQIWFRVDLMGRTPKPRSKSDFRPFAAARFPIHAAVTAITSCVTMMHADMNGAAAFGLPFDSISPSCGNIAALAK